MNHVIPVENIEHYTSAISMALLTERTKLIHSVIFRCSFSK